MLLFNGSGIGRKFILNLVSLALDREMLLFTSTNKTSCLKEFNKLLFNAFQSIFIEDKRFNIVIYENQISNIEVFDEIVRFIKTKSIRGIGKEEIENLA